MTKSRFEGGYTPPTIHVWGICPDCQQIADIAAGRCGRCAELVTLRAEVKLLKHWLLYAGNQLAHDAACWRAIQYHAEKPAYIREVARLRSDSLNTDVLKVIEALSNE